MDTSLAACHTDTRTNNNSAGGWRDLVKNLDSSHFSLEIRNIMRPDAMKDFLLDATIHFERTGDTTYKVLVEARNLKNVHGWECPATLTFIVETLAARLTAAHGFNWYRTCTPENDTDAGNYQLLQLEMLDEAPESTSTSTSTSNSNSNSNSNSAVNNESSWAKAMPVVPRHPDMSRELLRSGFSW